MTINDLLKLEHTYLDEKYRYTDYQGNTVDKDDDEAYYLRDTEPGLFKGKYLNHDITIYYERFTVWGRNPDFDDIGTFEDYKGSDIYVINVLVDGKRTDPSKIDNLENSIKEWISIEG